jgi:hypothetical protein
MLQADGGSLEEIAVRPYRCDGASSMSPQTPDLGAHHPPCSSSVRSWGIRHRRVGAECGESLLDSVAGTEIRHHQVASASTRSGAHVRPDT